MKKVFTALCLLTLTSSLTACGSTASNIANPYTEYDTVEEAAANTGFDINVPDSISNYDNKFIQVLTDEGSEKMIEVVYQNDEDQIRIRKAAGTEDISGNYDTYNQSTALTVEDTEISIKGNDGTVNLATWTDGEYTYSVYTSAGMTADEIADFVAEMI